MDRRLRVGVAGASGYVGGELLRRLGRHPRVRLVRLGAQERAGRAVAQVHPALRGGNWPPLETPDWEAWAADCEVVFLALPHGVAGEAAAGLRAAGVRVIDLGPDFRLRDPAVYEAVYGRPHSAPERLAEAVYGLTELARPALPTAGLVANPGCYATAAALALRPLAAAGWLAGPVIVDGKSGVSGAGRSARVDLLAAEVDGNLRPYHVGVHRHEPEMAQTLAALGVAVPVLFAPHLVPMPRGLLVTVYAPLARPLGASAAQALYEDAYAGEPFVRVLPPGEWPQTKATWGSNYVDVAVQVHPASGVAVVAAALDNLGKGAAGQAVQNLNAMQGWPETWGLEDAPVWP